MSGLSTSVSIDQGPTRAAILARGNSSRSWCRAGVLNNTSPIWSSRRTIALFAAGAGPRRHRGENNPRTLRAASPITSTRVKSVTQRRFLNRYVIDQQPTRVRGTLPRRVRSLSRADGRFFSMATAVPAACGQDDSLRDKPNDPDSAGVQICPRGSLSLALARRAGRLATAVSFCNSTCWRTDL